MLRPPQMLRPKTGLEPEAVRRVVEALRRGALVLLPTDTVYGIAADPRVPGAEARLAAAKGRPRTRPIPFLAAGRADVERCGAEFDATARRLADAFWPGPVTLVLSCGDKFEGFRVPACAPTVDVLRASGGVLRVTSANRSGEPPALTAEEAVRALGDSVEVALDGGPASGSVPSTVVKVENGTARILREGAVGRREIEAAVSGRGNAAGGASARETAG